MKNFLAFPLHHFSFGWFCARIAGKLWAEGERVCDEIGVPDRTREEGPGLDFSYHLMEPFGM